jgi:hypothetical protein
LRADILEACRLGIFQWDRGRFLPKERLTNAQAMTVLVRIMEGKKNENLNPRYRQYRQRLAELWITNGLSAAYINNGNRFISRWDVALMVYRARVFASYQTPINDNPIVQCQVPWWWTIGVWQTIVRFAQSSVPIGSSCQSQIRTCQSNGMLDGSFTATSCTVVWNLQRSCMTPWWQTVAHGTTVTAYAQVLCGTSQHSQTAVCDNGTLSLWPQFIYQYPVNCQNPPQQRSCMTPWWQTVAHGTTVTAYAQVLCGTSQHSQTAVCDNGILSLWSQFIYQYPVNCQNPPQHQPQPHPVQCLTPWGTYVPEWRSQRLYSSTTDTAHACQSQIRTCQSNWLLDGSTNYKFQTCTSFNNQSWWNNNDFIRTIWQYNPSNNQCIAVNVTQLPLIWRNSKIDCENFYGIVTSSGWQQCVERNPSWQCTKYATSQQWSNNWQQSSQQCVERNPIWECVRYR